MTNEIGIEHSKAINKQLLTISEDLRLPTGPHVLSGNGGIDGWTCTELHSGRLKIQVSIGRSLTS